MDLFKEPNGPVYIIPKVFEDDRGYFFESFNEKAFKENVADVTFVQDNESMSQKNTIRGLHFQTGEYAQAKLVRVVQGQAVDVVVDIRKNSPNYGKVYYAVLTDFGHEQFFVPRGFAHGFIALADDTIFQYKCDNFYNKESEGGIAWDSIDFDWNGLLDGEPILSEKDKYRVSLADFDSPFEFINENEIDEQ